MAMDSRHINITVRLCLVVAAVGLALSSPLVAETLEYLHDDVRITGSQIHSFVDNGQNVTVVLGGFKLQVGKRVISARDAVIWVTPLADGGPGANDITVFAQGKARILEPNGSTTQDAQLLARFQHQGRLSAAGHLSSTPLLDFPIYKDAVRARKFGVQRSLKKPDVEIAKSAASATQPHGKGTLSPKAPAEPQVKPAPKLFVFSSTGSTNSEIERRDSKQAGVRPVCRRITVVDGNVYIGYGDSDSDDFIELRAQSAVVISIPKTDKAGKPKVTSLVGGANSSESLVGVYLEGDVVISSGERFFRGPKAYYDFTTDRSILENAVFRTIEPKRNIPVYIRAAEARSLSNVEFWFKDAKISSSDFRTPTYHIGVSRAYLKDVTIYEKDDGLPKGGFADMRRGERLSERSFFAELWDPTFNVRSIPVTWWPYTQGDISDGNSAIRRVEIGSGPVLGFGVNTEWHMFRLLGLVKPDGFDGTLQFGIFGKGVAGGMDLEYVRENFSGYVSGYGVLGNTGDDNFGKDREDIEVSNKRNRFTWRHKHFLPNDWQIQAEISYLSDATFLERYFPNESRCGKEQETLLYAKKQRDNWAFEVLLKARLNDFQRQTESLPQVGFNLVGQPIGPTPLVWFSQQHAGVVRTTELLVRTGPTQWSGVNAGFTADTRQELTLPLQVGQVQVVPFAVGGINYWEYDDFLSDGDRERSYGQVGVRASTQIWRLFKGVESRTWDLHGLRHVIAPEFTAFIGTYDSHFDRGMYGWLRNGAQLAVTQRLQTKRGPVGDRRMVDWMRLKVAGGVFNDEESGPLKMAGRTVFNQAMPRFQMAGGRLFTSRPEHSIGRDFVNLDYEWNVSDGTQVTSDMNYDIDRGKLGYYGAGIKVTRTPRFSYRAALRAIPDADSSVGTLGFSYKLNRKYTVGAFGQYDFDFDGGGGVSAAVTVVRKFPRWYAGITIVGQNSTDDYGIYLNLWPEGVPDFRVSSGRFTLLGASSKN